MTYNHLGRYEPLARVSTPSGMVAPFAVNTMPPDRARGLSNDVLQRSRAIYWRDVRQVPDASIQRRQGGQTNKPRRKPRPQRRQLGQPV